MLVSHPATKAITLHLLRYYFDFAIFHRKCFILPRVVALSELMLKRRRTTSLSAIYHT